MHLEVHGGGVGNLHALGAMISPGLYYERDLLHAFIDYDATPPWLNTPVDPMDDEGFIHISSEPGLGYDINLGLRQQPPRGLIRSHSDLSTWGVAPVRRVTVMARDAVE